MVKENKKTSLIVLFSTMLLALALVPTFVFAAEQGNDLQQDKTADKIELTDLEEFGEVTEATEPAEPTEAAEFGEVTEATEPTEVAEPAKADEMVETYAGTNEDPADYTIYYNKAQQAFFKVDYYKEGESVYVNLPGLSLKDGVITLDNFNFTTNQAIGLDLVSANTSDTPTADPFNVTIVVKGNCSINLVNASESKFGVSYNINAYNYEVHPNYAYCNLTIQGSSTSDTLSLTSNGVNSSNYYAIDANTYTQKNCKVDISGSYTKTPKEGEQSIAGINVSNYKEVEVPMSMTGAEINVHTSCGIANATFSGVSIKGGFSATSSTITIDNDLTGKAKPDASYGIHARNGDKSCNSTISKSTVSCNPTSAYYESTAIENEGNLSIDASTVEAYGQAVEYTMTSNDVNFLIDSVGISCHKNLDIKQSNVKAHGSTAKTTKQMGDQTFIASAGILCRGDVTLTSGTLESISDEAPISCGLCIFDIDLTTFTSVNNSLIVKDGDITATSAKADSVSVGIFAADLYQSGGNVIATAGASLCNPIQFVKSFDAKWGLSAGMVIFMGTGMTMSYGNFKAVGGDISASTEDIPMSIGLLYWPLSDYAVEKSLTGGNIILTCKSSAPKSKDAKITAFAGSESGYLPFDTAKVSPKCSTAQDASVADLNEKLTESTISTEFFENMNVYNAGTTEKLAATIGYKNMCYVTYKLNNGSEDVVDTVAINTAVTKPADPKREGYSFLGWYSNPELTKAYDFSTPVKTDLTLYAKWAKTGITFNLPEGISVNQAAAELAYKRAQEKNPGAVIELEFAAKKEAESTKDVDIIKQHTGDKNLECYSIQMLISVNGNEKTNYGDTNDVVLPITYNYDFTNKTNIVAHRVHNGEYFEFSDTPSGKYNESAKVDSDAGTITVNASKYSTYAFSNDVAGSSNGNASTTATGDFLIWIVVALVAVVVASGVAVYFVKRKSK